MVCSKVQNGGKDVAGRIQGINARFGEAKGKVRVV
jgi:hypothetical protein